MARRPREPAHLAPAELLTFDRADWERGDDDGRWQPAFQRWWKARAEFREKYPDSDTLGNRLEQIRLEVCTQQNTMRAEWEATHGPDDYPTAEL
jgi:hypothetical protein